MHELHDSYLYAESSVARLNSAGKLPLLHLLVVSDSSTAESMALQVSASDGVKVRITSGFRAQSDQSSRPAKLSGTSGVQHISQQKAAAVGCRETTPIPEQRPEFWVSYTGTCDHDHDANAN